MSFLSNNLKQTAVYWALTGLDGYGQHTYAEPVELDCRWEDKQEKFTDLEGNENVSQALVYFKTDITKGLDGWGFLFLGSLTDLASDTSNPTSESLDPYDIYEIKSYRKTPTIKNSRSERKVWL